MDALQKKESLVSILMTSYNREKYIAEAIESVLNSSYQDFELIIVDDTSTDKTVQIARYYEKKDLRVKVYVNTKNLGDYPNRNKAASYAQGKYLKYLDADDYIYPWGLELLVDMMEKFPDAGWGLCSLEQNIENPFPFILSPREAYQYHYQGPGLFHKAPLSAIIKRSVFETEHGFAHDRMTGDFEMWHRLALKYFVLLMPGPIVWYREHGEQEIVHYRKFISQYEEIKVKYLLSPLSPLSKSEIHKIIKKSKKRIIKDIIRSILSLNQKNTYDNWIKLKKNVFKK